MKKITVLLGALALAAGVSAVGIATPQSGANAHTGAETAAGECVSASTGTGRITFTVSNDHPLVATVTASDNAAVAVGSTIPKSGTKSFKQTIPAPAAGVTGSATIALRWSDGFEQAGITAAATIDASCTGPAAVVVPALAVTPPTCTVDGSLPFTSNPPAQNANGYEFPGLGYRVYLSPAYTGPGTYTATVQKIGAGFDPAFPNGTTVTGATSQTLTVLAATGLQSADPTAACFDRPAQPEPQVIVSDWVDQRGSINCTAETALQTRTTTTTVYVWDETTHAYVLDTANTMTTNEEQSRPLTDKEIAACNPTAPPTDEPTPPTDQPTVPTPTGGTTPSAPAPAAPTASAVAAPVKTATAAPVAVDTSSADTLAYTGANVVWPITAAAALLLTGITLFVFGPIRRRFAGRR